MYDPTKPWKKELKQMIRETWQTSYCTVREPGVVKKRDIIAHTEDYPHTDGVGSKGTYHW